MENTQNQQPADRNLIDAAAKGDTAAFRAVVEQHQAMVYRTCLRVLRNSADAEDAAQATFIVFHKKCTELKRDIVLGGWFYRTAELVCREFIRSSNRRTRREEETAMRHETTARENDQVWASLQPELDQAMMTLPQKYRDVVVLRYLEGRSTGETALAMGLSDSAVTTRLARAIDQLRNWFERRGVVLGAGVLPLTLAANANAATVPASLAGSTLAATASQAATAAGSTKAGLMANAALAKMGVIAWQVLDVFVFVGWILSTMDWVRRGCPIPRWVHILATSLLAAGLALTATIGVMGWLTLPLAAGLILIPPVAAYTGWLAMFGPEHAKRR